MDEKNVQLFETTLATESAKAVTEVGKNVAEDLVRPTSQSIGENLGLLVDGVMGWLGVWGQKQVIKQEQNLQEYKNRISQKVNAISTENLKEPAMNIAGPAIEASKFFFEESYYKEMFANLIAASCDKSKDDKIHPSFVEIIKQLSPLDAKLLSLFKRKEILPIVNYTFQDSEGHSEDIMHLVFVRTLIESTKSLEANSFAISNLRRLGLVEIRFDAWISTESFYDRFKRTLTYYDLEKKALIKNKELNLEKGIVSITPLGKNFIDLCL